MIDDMDLAAEHVAFENESRVREAAGRSASIPAGAPGVCDECGEESKRLVHGRCAPCREELGEI